MAMAAAMGMETAATTTMMMVGMGMIRATIAFATAIVCIAFSLIASLWGASWAVAQDAPEGNVLLLYDRTTIALINISDQPIRVRGVTFWRDGGNVRYDDISGLAPALSPGDCIQIWTNEVNFIGSPPECTRRLRYVQTARPDRFFWIAGYDGESFRPKWNGSTLGFCPAAWDSVQRCTITVPQTDESGATPPIQITDPATNLALPAGMQVAYDADQLWIGNFTPETTLHTGEGLRILYTRPDGSPVLWTPVMATWDDGWERRGLAEGECLVLYSDRSKLRPLLPCTPVAFSTPDDPIWTRPFEVMGLREDRRSLCGRGTPIDPADGVVLCLIAG
jgi:hypothetical protein